MKFPLLVSAVSFPLGTDPQDFLAMAFLLLLVLVLFLNWIGLPANWIILGLIFLATLISPLTLDISFWLLACACAITGEVLEWLLMAARARQAGASKAGTLAGMIGAFAGALLCAPFLLGLGALLGALLGAFAGCYLVERMRGKPQAEAFICAKGTLVGRLLGATVKCGAGLAIIALLARRILHETLTVPELFTTAIQAHAVGHWAV